MSASSKNSKSSGILFSRSFQNDSALCFFVNEHFNDNMALWSRRGNKGMKGKYAIESSKELNISFFLCRDIKFKIINYVIKSLYKNFFLFISFCGVLSSHFVNITHPFIHTMQVISFRGLYYYYLYALLMIRIFKNIVSNRLLIYKVWEVNFGMDDILGRFFEWAMNRSVG